MSTRYYYIDKEGNRKKYIGNIIKNSDGSLRGVLTTSTRVKEKIELKYHPAVEHVEGYKSYFTYINDEGIETRYYSFYKNDENNQPYFTYISQKPISLIYHPITSENVEYYTYIVNESENLYTGEVIYNPKKNTYTGKI